MIIGINTNPELEKYLLLKSEDIGITPSELVEELLPDDRKISTAELLQLVKKRCSCRTIGKDDGDHTCFKHHDCRDGSCTHTDGGDE